MTDTGHRRIQPVSGRGLAVWFLFALLPMAAAWAGDEEINPSVYQIFDPETGYFIDVEPPPEDNQPNTAAAPNVPPDTPAIPDDPAPVVAPGPRAPGAVSHDLAWQVIGGVALILVAGFALRKHNSRNKHNQA